MGFPVLWLLLNAFKTNQEIYNIWKLFPNKFLLQNFANSYHVNQFINFGKFFLNSSVLTIITALCIAISAVLIGFGFSRFKFRGRNILFIIMVSTILLPNTILLIPNYIIFSKLNFIDTYLPFWIPAILGVNVFFNIMMYNFIDVIPKELDESCYMDGASSIIILVKIIIPLCKTALFSLLMISFIWNWNNFLEPLIYINTVAKYTVTIGLKMSIDIDASPVWGEIFAMSSFSILLPVVFFFISQKYLVQGIGTSGLKG